VPRSDNRSKSDAHGSARRGAGLLALCLALLSAQNAWAEDRPSDAPPEFRFRAGFFVGAHFLTGQTELGNAVFEDQIPESGFALGLRGSYVLIPHLAPGSRLDPALSIEAETRLTLSSTGGSQARPSEFAPVLGWRVHALLDLSPQSRFTPFVLLGGGGETVITNSPFLETDTDAELHVGLGGRFELSQRVEVRLDARVGFFAGRTDSAAPSFETLLGIAYRFGQRGAGRSPARPTPHRPSKAPATVDRDSAGVLDASDNCPDRPADLDGVEKTEGGPKENVNLAPTDAPERSEDSDSASDGLPDSVDKCPLNPETKNGFEDDDGCPDVVKPPSPPVTFTISGIRFQRGSARVSNRAETALDTAVLLLQANPGARIEISGHTDNQGNAAKNQALSQRRAESVKAYLVENGVDAGRLVTVGHGSTKPLASNDGPRGRRKNRRIEFRVLPAE